MKIPTPLPAGLLRDSARHLLPTAGGQLGLWLLTRAAMLLLALVLVACSRHTARVERPVSSHYTDVQATPLARLASASMTGAQAGESGFRLLPDGEEAWQARLALVRRATRSLDLQYYQIAHDRTGLQLLRELRDAARRGVRVRLLLDDLYAAGQYPLLAGLAAHPNTEVRMFNPLPVRRGGFVTRIVLSLHEFKRINRRMHNKLFIADNSWSISGGRNIADEYFGRGEQANFIDLDVLAAGPAVGEQSGVFDRYWNSEHAYPVEDLHSEPSQLSGALMQAISSGSHRAADDLNDPASAEARDLTTQVNTGLLQLHFGPARVVADDPQKANAGQAAAEGEVAKAHTALIQSAQDEMTIASPYFVPGDSGMATVQAAAARKVRVTVLTNSHATTDEPVVHMGYAKYREALIDMGVDLRELAPSVQATAHKPTELHPLGSLGRWHAKLSIADGRRTYIGSMNMDRRSVLTNTESGLIIDSGRLARRSAIVLGGSLAVSRHSAGSGWMPAYRGKAIGSLGSSSFTPSAPASLAISIQFSLVPEWML